MGILESTNRGASTNGRGVTTIAFEQLPNRITGPLPEIYRNTPIQPAPVYDTTAMIQPLMKLADYLSPEKRALRQAMIAKANAEWRDSQPGGRIDQMWYFQNEARKNSERRARAEESRSSQRFDAFLEDRKYAKEDRDTLRSHRKRQKDMDDLADQAFRDALPNK